MCTVLAEEIPQMNLDTGVSTQRCAELSMLFALVLAVGCCEIALGNADKRPARARRIHHAARLARRQRTPSESTDGKVRHLNVPEG